MAVKLYDYQKEALRKLKNGNILYGNVGSGKSMVGIAYYFKECGGQIFDDRLEPMTNPINLIIITTAKKRDKCEWDFELGNFLLDRDKNISYYKVDIKVDSWNNISKYSEITNSFFIFDEQRLVGNGTWVKSFLKIAKSNKWILLSATPGDEWKDYVPVFIANGFYKNRTQFMMRHAVMSPFTTFPKIDRYVETDLLERYRDSILVGMVRDRTLFYHSEDVICDYDENLYKEVQKKRVNPYTNEPIHQASEYCQVLRKISNCGSNRLNELIKIIEEKKKVVVFYNFDYELDILRTLSSRYKIGEWNGHKHEEIPCEYDHWVYLVNYIGGSEAWNCILTDTIVFYSLSYSYKIMKQASGRIDRVNTTFDDLYYYYFYTESKIDQHIKKALKDKQDFNEKAFINAGF